jgi:hypothetical protein
MAFAAYRIYQYAKDNQMKPATEGEESYPNPFPLQESNQSFAIETIVKSIVAAIAVKYGELYFDFPFNPNLLVATSLIGVPTMANVAKWTARSKNP